MGAVISFSFTQLGAPRVLVAALVMSVWFVCPVFARHVVVFARGVIALASYAVCCHQSALDNGELGHIFPFT